MRISIIIEITYQYNIIIKKYEKDLIEISYQYRNRNNISIIIEININNIIINDYYRISQYDKLISNRNIIEYRNI
jgi:hypothetical protein